MTDFNLEQFSGEAPLEVDDEHGLQTDVDSLYSPTGESSTTSLSSSVTSYQYENGRRYHAYREGAYVLPNDEEEQERLDIVHHQLLVALDGRLHICKFDDPPQRILDVGTGTGIWAIDMANEYPSAEIIGTDLSPIQPRWVPPNCRFEVDDAESDWTFQKDSFDMIHARHLGFAIKDWNKLIRQIYEHLAPGGWVQFSEHDLLMFSDDNTLSQKLNMKVMVDSANEAMSKMGRDPYFLPKMKGWLEDQGFEEIEEVKFKYPWGVWPKDKKLKEIGKWCLLEMEAGAFESYCIAMFTRVLGMELKDVHNMLDGAKREVRSGKYHVYVRGNFLVGRKPRPKEKGKAA